MNLCGWEERLSGAKLTFIEILVSVYVEIPAALLVIIVSVLSVQNDNAPTINSIATNVLIAVKTFLQGSLVPSFLTAQAFSHQDKILHFLCRDIPPKGNARRLYRGKFQVSGKRVDIH